MTLTRWAGASILLGLAAMGCQNKAKSQGSIYPAPVAVAPETRDRIRHVATDAITGKVIAVMPESRLVAVGDVPVQQFHKGDILMFLGGDSTSVGAGTVVNVLPDALHVRYEEPPVGGRPPAVGDLAIHFAK
ncbi:MAG: hypothetical protein ACM359_20220 [Bacillota bacterium]